MRFFVDKKKNNRSSQEHLDIARGKSKPETVAMCFGSKQGAANVFKNQDYNGWWSKPERREFAQIRQQSEAEQIRMIQSYQKYVSTAQPIPQFCF